jgi:hypothetical protein
MKARVWLRIAAALQALGTVGHTLNTVSGAATHGSQEQAVFDAMQTFHFEVMGATRTVWDFYRGYEFSITVIFAMMTVIIWILGNMSVSSPRRALPLVATIFVSEVLLSILSWTYFFAGPGVMSILICLCLAVAMVSMSGESLNSPHAAAS